MADKIKEISVFVDESGTFDSDVLALLREGFKPFGPRTEFVEDVTPGKYRLFQAADIIATLELVRAKLKADGRISSSEKGFFESVQKLNRVYLKPLSRKLWAWPCTRFNDSILRPRWRRTSGRRVHSCRGCGRWGMVVVGGDW